MKRLRPTTRGPVIQCVLLLLALNALQPAVLAQDFATNRYSISTEDFANPERGFYLQANSRASSPSTVPFNLADYRNNGRSDPNNTYTAKVSLVLRLFYLDTFVNAPISSNFLNSIQADLNSIRAQGDKAVVRFAYNTDDVRPFDEPTKARILEHIQQLKPLLQQNSDVIAVVQQGFIAAWGEGYYTDIFYTDGRATAQNWLDRFEVLNALLNAVPTNRMVQVRIPQLKQRFVNGLAAPTSVAPMSPAEAFSGSARSRIGFHNDCFLASSTDYGTFSVADYGVSTTTQDTTNLRNYTAQETRFVPNGGETCVLNPPTDDCGCVGGNADVDMAFSHYSFLHQGYNANLNDDWVAQGCIEDIKRRLGYRLQLLSAVLRTEARPGQAIPVTMMLQNTGFAAPYNPRGVELVLRHTTTGAKYFAQLSRDVEARRWLPGTNTFSTMISLPPDLPLGGYEMFLHLPDPAPSLYGIVPYSIRLANSNALSAAGNSLGDVWDPATGYHRLRHILNINNTATNAAPTGTEIRLLSYSVIAASNVNFVDPASPADRTTSTGQTATFSAPVTGTGPLRYQWLKDGASLPGATNATLVLSNVQPADAATYALQVSNPVSTNTSRTATLTVLPAAHRTISIDGNFNDWQNLAPIYSSGSNSPAATNPRDFYVCNDADFIYLMVTTWNPSVLVSSINNFYFNTDHNPATGYLSMGGSELLLQNGAGYQQKTGVFNFGTVTGLQHLCAPTGSASQFEFRLSRNALNTSDGTPVFKTNVISFVFEGENASFQTVNRVPANGAIQYTLVEPHPPGPLAIDSNGGGQLAVSWVGTGTLQTRSSLTGGVWTDLPAATSPCLIVATGAQQYFRLAR